MALRMLGLSWVLVAVGCATPRLSPDGIYAVLEMSSDRDALLPLKGGDALVVHPEAYRTGEVAPSFLRVRVPPVALLSLSENPRAVLTEDGQTEIYLQLASDPTERFARFTRENPMHKVAVVIDGEAVTVHKVRSPIEGGNIRVTSCTAGAAEHLLEHLRARE